MEALATHLPDLAIAAALAWGAGLRLYLVTFVFGFAAWMGWWPLPEHLSVLSHPLVLGASGFMSLVEGFADKLPFLDSAWDAVHTFIRVPAGAALAAAAFGADETAVMVAAGLLGGTLTAATHVSKAGTRVAVNASPEPVSNMLVSTAEDAAVLGGSWLAVTQPALFLGLLGVFLVLAALLMRVLVRGARRLAGGLRRRPGT